MHDLPLDRYRLFESRDVDETREHVAQVFCDHKLALVGRESRIRSKMNCQRIHHVAVSAITYGGDVRVDPGETEEFFPVMALISGKGTFHSGSETLHAVPGIIPVGSPTIPLRMRLAAGTKLVIARIERPALEATLSDMLDQSLPWPLEFQLGLDATKRWGQRWYESLRLCAEELDRNDRNWAYSPMARGTEALLMEGLLMAQPNNYSELLAGEARPVPNRTVNLAVEKIQAHPEREHTIASLARTAQVSTRALQEGFKRYLRTTPTLYLREVRLERAHEALRAAQAGTTTVGEVAKNCGFPHVSRFAGWYKQHFGETPSETLHR